MLTIFKGDDTNGRFGRVLNLNITVAAGTSLDGCRAAFSFDGVVREFTNIVSGTPVQLVFGHDETASMAEGIRYATLRIYDPDGNVRTFDNTIAVKVTSSVAEAYPGSDTATISISGSVAWVDITGKPSWIGTTKPSYTAYEVGALPCTTNADLTKNVGIQRIDFLRAAVGVGCVATGGTTGGAFAVGRNLRALGEYGMAGGHRAMTADGAKYAFAFGNRTYAATGSVAFGYQAWSAAAGQFLNDDTDVVSGLGAKHKYSFAWQGKDDSTPGYYHTHGDGTFNINPIGGTAGFYIGEQSLPQVIAAAITGKLDATAQAADSAKLGGTAAADYALKTDNAPGLTDAGLAAVFANAVSSTTSTTLKDRDCATVAFSSGMTLTFTASTGLRQFEILITDCTASGSINFPDVTYRGASDALTLEAGDNHLVFAEYAANCFFVTRAVANTITIS